jgi:hypothetical protein
MRERSVSRPNSEVSEKANRASSVCGQSATAHGYMGKPFRRDSGPWFSRKLRASGARKGVPGFQPSIFPCMQLVRRRRSYS